MVEKLNRKEFIAAWQKVHRNVSGVRAWITAASFLGWLAMLAYIRNIIVGSNLSKPLIFMLISIFLLSFPLLMTLHVLYVKPVFGRCPNCHGRITLNTRQVIVATGCCEYCGEKILTDPEDDAA